MTNHIGLLKKEQVMLLKILNSYLTLIKSIFEQIS